MAGRAISRWIKAGALDGAVRDEVDRIRVVDTHEHLEEEAARLAAPNTLSGWFMFYAFDDLASAGLPDGARERFFAPDAGAAEQWALIREAWSRAGNTGYCRALRIAMKDLYGVEDMTDASIPRLLKARARRNRPGVLRWILEERAGIECCLVNAIDAPPGELCRRTAHPGLFLFDLGVAPWCGDHIDVAAYERASGIGCQSFADWKRIMDWSFARWGRQAVAVKNQCAYWRSLDFEDVPDTRAAPLFERWLLRRAAITPDERKAVQDFNFHYCIRRAADLDLPVKIHTGYHAGHGYMRMELFQPKALAPLFRRYPNVKFDLFHIGYPEHLDVVALAKHYPNVYADLCWAWIIDPQASLQFARQALEALPVNKVFGFGGDYGTADVVVGHGRMARDGIALVLTEAVREGRLTRAEAKRVARCWLRENAMSFYRIEEKRAAQAAGQPGP